MSRTATLPSSTAISRRRCSMARKRVSMREGPLAELFRATEAAQDKGASTRDTRSQPELAQTEILSVVPDPAPEPAPTLIAAPEPEPEQEPEPEPEPEPE